MQKLSKSASKNLYCTHTEHFNVCASFGLSFAAAVRNCYPINNGKLTLTGVLNQSNVLILAAFTVLMSLKLI